MNAEVMPDLVTTPNVQQHGQRQGGFDTSWQTVRYGEGGMLKWLTCHPESQRIPIYTDTTKMTVGMACASRLAALFSNIFFLILL